MSGPHKMLADLRWKPDMKIINHEGESVWLKESFNQDGERDGITDCCLTSDPCDWHKALEGEPRGVSDAMADSRPNGWCLPGKRGGAQVMTDPQKLILETAKKAHPPYADAIEAALKAVKKAEAARAYIASELDREKGYLEPDIVAHLEQIDEILGAPK